MCASDLAIVVEDFCFIPILFDGPLIGNAKLFWAWIFFHFSMSTDPEMNLEIK
jgi:hypothetical protein